MANSKKKNQLRHAQRRALQRYDLDLSHNDLALFVKQIQDGKATFYDRDSNRITLWIIQHNGQNIKVVYDKMRKTIVTCLPLTDTLI